MMTKTRMIVVLAAGIAALASVSLAMEPVGAPWAGWNVSRRELTAIVRGCVPIARIRDASFDAFVANDGTIQTMKQIGNEGGSFTFQRCLNEAGVILGRPFTNP